MFLSDGIVISHKWLKDDKTHKQDRVSLTPKWFPYINFRSHNQRDIIDIIHPRPFLPESYWKMLQSPKIVVIAVLYLHECLLSITLFTLDLQVFQCSPRVQSNTTSDWTNAPSFPRFTWSAACFFFSYCNTFLHIIFLSPSSPFSDYIFIRAVSSRYNQRWHDLALIKTAWA